MIRIRYAAAAGCVAAALAAGAAPALADTQAAVATSAAATSPAVAPSQDAREAQRAQEPVICARIEVPARRVRPRICKTRAQWEQEYGGVPTDR